MILKTIAELHYDKWKFEQNFKKGMFMLKDNNKNRLMNFNL